MDATDSQHDELDAVQPGVPGMNPTIKLLLDFCCDEIVAIERRREAQLTSSSILMTIYGLLLGLVIGFVLGDFLHTVLFQECRGLLCLD